MIGSTGGAVAVDVFNNLERLLESLGADVVVMEGGPTILGVALEDGRGTRLISLNDQVMRDPHLYRAVLAHEVAHLTIRGQAGLCAIEGDMDGAETEAWAWATMMLVPIWAGMAVHAGIRTADDVARELDVPVALIRLRAALVDVAMHYGDGGVLGTLSDAMDDLLAWVRDAWGRCQMA